MPRYKRSAEEAQLDAPTEPAMAPETAETLKELRNMWEFASLMQYIFLFGDAVKIDEDFDIEVPTRPSLPTWPALPQMMGIPSRNEVLTGFDDRTSNMNASCPHPRRSSRRSGSLCSRPSPPIED